MSVSKSSAQLGHPDVEPTIFLVHGRDDGAKHGVARFVQDTTGLAPIILAEQPDLGQTVIEKFEKHASQVSYAIVLLTGDDEGRLSDRRRSASDIRGILYAELDSGEGWKIQLAREMKAAGLPVDMNKVL